MASPGNLIITGIAGFLGRHIARHFARLGWSITGLDTAAPRSAQLEGTVRYVQMELPSTDLVPLLKNVSPNVCIHCAGRASVPASMKEPAADFRDNAALTFEILEGLRHGAPNCRFMLLSSAAVYGNPSTLPVDENHRADPLSTYGFHKLQCELMLREFSKIYSMPTLAVRIFSAYGPGLRRQVVWDICEKLLTHRELTLGGTGAESRDFIHAEDVAGALALLAEKAPATSEIYNVATGRETTISELADILATSLESKVKAKFDGMVRAGDPKNWRADIGKIRALGFEPAISLEEGLKQAAKWAREELAR